MVRHRQKKGVTPRSEMSRVRGESSAYQPSSGRRRLSISSANNDSSSTVDSSTNNEASSFIHVPISSYSTRNSSRDVGSTTISVTGPYSTSARTQPTPSTFSLRSRTRRSTAGVSTRSSRTVPPELSPRPPDSPPRRTRPLVPPGNVDDDEEDPCSICLDKRTNEAAILYCMHRYCFLCIKRWAEGSNNTCPLCKMIFNEIAFNIRSDTDYDVYKIKHRRSSAFPTRSMLFSSDYRPFGSRLESGLDLSVTNQGRPEPSYLQLHMARQLGMMEMRGMRGENMISARVMLYQSDRRSISPSRTLGVTAPSPSDFSVNETLIHRLIPFLYREISVVFAIIGSLREAIISNIKQIVRTYPVNDERFSAEVRNVFAGGVIGRVAAFPARYVSIFIDELAGFIENNQEIEEFDRLNPVHNSQNSRRRVNSPSRHNDMNDSWRRTREYDRPSFVHGPRASYFSRFLDANAPTMAPSNSSSVPEDLSSTTNARSSFSISTTSPNYNQEFPALNPDFPATAPRLPYAHHRHSAIESPIWSSLAHENLRERMRLMDSDDDITLNLMVQNSSPFRDRVLRNNDGVTNLEQSTRRSSSSSVFSTAGSGERVRAVHITSGPNPLYIRMPLRASYSSISMPSTAATAPEPEFFSLPPPPDPPAHLDLPDLQLGPVSAELTGWPPVSPPLLSPAYDPPSPPMPLLAGVDAPQAEPSTSQSPVTSAAEPVQKLEKVEQPEEEEEEEATTAVAAVAEAVTEEATTSSANPERPEVPVIEISSDEEPVCVSRRRKSKDQRKHRSGRHSRDDDCVILGQIVEIQLSSEDEAPPLRPILSSEAGPQPSTEAEEDPEHGGPWRPWQAEQGGPSVPQLIAFKQQRASSASDSSDEEETPNVSSSSSTSSSTSTGTSSTEPMHLDSSSLECGSSVYIHSRQGRMDIRRQKRQLRRRRRYYEDKLRFRRPVISSTVVVPPYSSLATKFSPPKQEETNLEELGLSLEPPLPPTSAVPEVPEILSAQDVSQVLSVLEMSLPSGRSEPSPKPQAKNSFTLPQELDQLSSSTSDLSDRRTEALESKTIDLTVAGSAEKKEKASEFIDLASTVAKRVRQRITSATQLLRGKRRRDILRRFLKTNETEVRRPDFKRKFPKWRERPPEKATPAVVNLVSVAPKKTKSSSEPVKRKMKVVVEKKAKDVVDLVHEEEEQHEEGEEGQKEEPKEEESEERTTLRDLEFVYPRTMDEFYRSVRGETVIEVPSTSSASPVALPSPAKQNSEPGVSRLSPVRRTSLPSQSSGSESHLSETTLKRKLSSDLPSRASPEKRLASSVSRTSPELEQSIQTCVKRKSPSGFSTASSRDVSVKVDDNLVEVVNKKMRLSGEGDGNVLSPMLERMDIEVVEAKGRVVEEMEVDSDCRHPEPESMEIEVGEDSKSRLRPLMRRRWRSAEDVTRKKNASVGTQARCRCDVPLTTKSSCTQTESADLNSNGVSSTSSFLHNLCAPSSPLSGPLSTLDRTSSSSSSFVAVASGSCTPDLDPEMNKDNLGRQLEAVTEVCVGSTSSLD